MTNRRIIEVKLECGETLRMRRAGLSDLLAAGGNPDLAAAFLRGERETLRKSEETLRRSAARVASSIEDMRGYCAALVGRCLLPSADGSTPDVQELTLEELALAAVELQRESGFSKEEADKTAPLSGQSVPPPAEAPPCAPASGAPGTPRESASPSSTSSQGDTESGPAKS